MIDEEGVSPQHFERLTEKIVKVENILRRKHLIELKKRSKKSDFQTQPLLSSLVTLKNIPLGPLIMDHSLSHSATLFKNLLVGTDASYFPDRRQGIAYVSLSAHFASVPIERGSSTDGEMQAIATARIEKDSSHG